MKAAILIMAHDQPIHFARLARSLHCDWARIFVHIDRKVDAAVFAKLADGQRNIEFLAANQRVDVSWGGFSQVAATLNLLRVASTSRDGFDRFCLLSGADFPIKPLEHIEDRFGTDREFIRIDRKVDGSRSNGHCRNVAYFHFMDGPLLRRWRLSGVVPRRVYDRVTLYHGAQWWSLTRGCVEYVLAFLRENGDFARFHRWTLGPDEIFFHSIVKASPFAANVTHDFEREPSYADYLSRNEHGCTYIDWNARDVPLPKVLTVDDYGDLARSACLFARKFDERRSAALIQRLVAAGAGARRDA